MSNSLMNALFKVNRVFTRAQVASLCHSYFDPKGVQQIMLNDLVAEEKLKLRLSDPNDPLR